MVQALIATKMQNLEEFRFYFEGLSKIEPWLNRIQLGEGKTGGALASGERLPPAGYTGSLQGCCGRNGGLVGGQRASGGQGRCPPDLHPLDATVSRMARKMDRRMLCVFELSRVHSLQQQLLASSRKRKLAEGLYVEESESAASAVVAQDVETYLQQLFTLMLAYAFAGVHPKVGAPEASTTRR